MLKSDRELAQAAEVSLDDIRRVAKDVIDRYSSKDKYSSALFTMRSGMLAWQEQQGKEEPWQKHRLTLACSLDTRFWSGEGTEVIRQQKAIEVKLDMGFSDRLKVT